MLVLSKINNNMKTLENIPKSVEERIFSMTKFNYDIETKDNEDGTVNIIFDSLVDSDKFEDFLKLFDGNIMTHDLKIQQPCFDDIWGGTKTFELRKNDRGFQVGDNLRLREYDPKTKKYSGNHIAAEITYLIDDFEGLKEGWVILGLFRRVMVAGQSSYAKEVKGE
jgi:hypothetical protein